MPLTGAHNSAQKVEKEREYRLDGVGEAIFHTQLAGGNQLADIELASRDW